MRLHQPYQELSLLYIAAFCFFFSTVMFASECKIAGVKAPQAVCDTPDGIHIVGEFNPNRKTVMFIHGWIPTYEIGLPDFPNSSGWQQAGFNTLIFLFHNQASDAGQGEKCEVLPGLKLPNFLKLKVFCPNSLESRVWNKGGIADQLYSEYVNFFKNYPNYSREIRVVGHSLSTQLATNLTYRLASKSHEVPVPARLELIDPWVGHPLLDTGEVVGELSIELPKGVKCSNSSFRSNTYCIMENLIKNLRTDADIPVTVYGSTSSSVFAHGLRDITHYVALDSKWLCKRSRFSNSPFCTFKWYSLYTAQHFFPLLSYFWSINEPIPLNGITAKTSTKSLKTKSRFFVKQLAVGNWCNLEKGIPFWKRGGTGHVFWASRYRSGKNGGVQKLSSSAEDFSNMLVKVFKFSNKNADQCAKAISFSNDIFKKTVKKF